MILSSRYGAYWRMAYKISFFMMRRFSVVKLRYGRKDIKFSGLCICGVLFAGKNSILSPDFEHKRYPGETYGPHIPKFAFL